MVGVATVETEAAIVATIAVIHKNTVKKASRVIALITKFTVITIRKVQGVFNVVGIVEISGIF